MGALGIDAWGLAVQLVAFLVFINEDVWKSLPADIQQTMAEIGQKVGVSLAQEIQKAEDATIEKLRSSGKQV